MATFTALGVSANTFVKGGTTFRLSVSNTWVGTFQVQESRNGAISYELIEQLTTNIAQDYPAVPYDRVVRLQMTAFTSGTLTYTITSNASVVGGPTKIYTVPIGNVAYTAIETNGVAGTSTTMGCVAFNVPTPFLTTGGAVLNGTTVTTNKYVYLLYDASGALKLFTALAGVATATASVFQQIAWAQGPQTIPAGNYIFGCQIDGNTDTMRHVITSVNSQQAMFTVASVFGTAEQFIVPVTTFTTAVAPYSFIY